MRRGQKQKLALWSIKMDGELRAKSTRKSPNSREKMFKYRHVFNHPQILTRCKMFYENRF